MIYPALTGLRLACPVCGRLCALKMNVFDLHTVHVRRHWAPDKVSHCSGDRHLLRRPTFADVNERGKS